MVLANTRTKIKLVESKYLRRILQSFVRLWTLEGTLHGLSELIPRQICTLLVQPQLCVSAQGAPERCVGLRHDACVRFRRARNRLGNFLLQVHISVFTHLCHRDLPLACDVKHGEHGVKVLNGIKGLRPVKLGLNDNQLRDKISTVSLAP